MIIEYIKEGNKAKKIYKKRGVLVAYANQGKILVGFSLCHKHHDRFDFIKGERAPNHGFNIAVSRAHEWENNGTFSIKGATGYHPPVIIPQSIQKRLHKFIVRASKYYQNTPLPVWAVAFKSYMDLALGGVGK
jgi:hypothetical protein